MSEYIPCYVDWMPTGLSSLLIRSLMVDGDSGRLSFQLPELSVAASFRNRQPWSEERPNSSGPEGWLQRTGLLPLHYFVVRETLKAFIHSSVKRVPRFAELLCAV